MYTLRIVPHEGQQQTNILLGNRYIIDTDLESELIKGSFKEHETEIKLIGLKNITGLIRSLDEDIFMQWGNTYYIMLDGKTLDSKSFFINQNTRPDLFNTVDITVSGHVVSSNNAVIFDKPSGVVKISTADEATFKSEPVSTATLMKILDDRESLTSSDLSKAVSKLNDNANDKLTLIKDRYNRKLNYIDGNIQRTFIVFQDRDKPAEKYIMYDQLEMIEGITELKKPKKHVTGQPGEWVNLWDVYEIIKNNLNLKNKHIAVFNQLVDILSAKDDKIMNRLDFFITDAKNEPHAVYTDGFDYYTLTDTIKDYNCFYGKESLIKHTRKILTDFTFYKLYDLYDSMLSFKHMPNANKITIEDMAFFNQIQQIINHGNNDIPECKFVSSKNQIKQCAGVMVRFGDDTKNFYMYRDLESKNQPWYIRLTDFEKTDECRMSMLKFRTYKFYNNHNAFLAADDVLLNIGIDTVLYHSILNIKKHYK